MDIRDAIDNLIMAAAGDHIDAQTGERVHDSDECELCRAMEVAQTFCDTGMTGGLRTGEPVTVGTARGRVSYVQTWVGVQLDDVGLVIVTPENIKRPKEIPARIKSSPDGRECATWKPNVPAAPWFAIYGPRTGRYLTDDDVAGWSDWAPVIRERNE